MEPGPTRSVEPTPQVAPLTNLSQAFNKGLWVETKSGSGLRGIPGERCWRKQADPGPVMNRPDSSPEGVSDVTNSQKCAGLAVDYNVHGSVE